MNTNFVEWSEAALRYCGNILQPELIGSRLVDKVKFRFSFDGMHLTVSENDRVFITIRNGLLTIRTGNSEKKYREKISIPDSFRGLAHKFQSEGNEIICIRLNKDEPRKSCYDVTVDDALVAKTEITVGQKIEETRIITRYSPQYESIALAAAALMWRFAMIPPPNA